MHTRAKYERWAPHQAAVCLAGVEEVKVNEQQLLEVARGADGVMLSMKMTSSPSLYMPGVGNMPMGDVVFFVSGSGGDQTSCKVRSATVEGSLHPPQHVHTKAAAGP